MKRMTDVEKVQEACARSPGLSNILVGKRLLRRLCKDVERYRVENDDLQRYGEALTRALDGEVKPDVTH